MPATDNQDRDFLAKNGQFLALHGPALIEQGYTVVPIQPGKKAPGFDGWQKARATKAQVDEWLKSGHRYSGVGINTKDTPAIDIDVREERIALKVEAFVRELVGNSPLRIGFAPKRLMLFRTDEPFRKMRSKKYIDEWNDLHQIEILGDGQQCVAYHKHPETGKPYSWPNEGQNPLEVRAADLLPITVVQCEAIITYFEELAAEEADWKVASKGRSASASAGDASNPFIEDTAPVTISDDELRSRLMLIPHPEDYHEWINIGMALYHQYDGDELGLKLWHEWAESADNYDGDGLDRRWDGFKVNGKKRAPITARYILKVAQETSETATAELALSLRDLFNDAKDMTAWEKARQAAREAEIDALSRSTLATVAKAKRDLLTGTKSAISEIKKAIAFLPKKLDKTPNWCKDWLYDTSEDRFFNFANKTTATQQGFNAMYDRQALTKKDILDGRSVPSSTASALALNMYKIPTVMGRRYMPGMDSIFTESDGKFANTYPEHEIPELPEKLTPRDKRNIERVKAHIRHLLPDEREQRMLLDWLSWVVQNPGKHARYAILLQGVEGDGKTFFAELMRAVMGVSNVTMLNAHILHSDFTDWAEGQCLACFEEVRLINDKNKYETLNRIKPYITNTINEIHPKGRPVYNATNTTSYLLFTNFKDALPIDDNSRRYGVLFSQWQNREALRDFKEANPNYYVDLYSVISDSAPAVRKWLLDHEQSDEFDPLGDAPETAARRQMIRRSKSAFQVTLEEVIDEDCHVGISADLIDGTAMNEAMYDRDVDVPPNRALMGVMERAGWESIGKFRGPDQEYRTYYARTPELFSKEGPNGIFVDRHKILVYLEHRESELSEL